MRALLYGLCLLLFAVLASPVSAAPKDVMIAGLDVALWTPPENTPGPWLVLVFSHGFNGCNTQSTFLMEALAESGYAVFAPNHQDAGCGGMMMWPTRPDAPFRDPDD